MMCSPDFRKEFVMVVCAARPLENAKPAAHMRGSAQRSHRISHPSVRSRRQPAGLRTLCASDFPNESTRSLDARQATAEQKWSPTRSARTQRLQPVTVEKPSRNLRSRLDTMGATQLHKQQWESKQRNRAKATTRQVVDVPRIPQSHRFAHPGAGQRG